MLSKTWSYPAPNRLTTSDHKIEVIFISLAISLANVSGYGSVKAGVGLVVESPDSGFFKTERTLPFVRPATLLLRGRYCSQEVCVEAPPPTLLAAVATTAEVTSNKDAISLFWSLRRGTTDFNQKLASTC